MVAPQILVLLVRVQILLGQIAPWSLRLTARTGDSHSSNRGSIPLGTKLETGPLGTVSFFTYRTQYS